MNVLLLDAGEVAADGTCRVDGRRARHLRDVLGVTAGSRLRAGIVGGALGTAEVLALADDSAVIVLRFVRGDAAVDASQPLAVGLCHADVVLAVPRPKAIARAIETCAAFGVRRVELTNAWRVDKSYLRSPKLAPEALALAARLGAEQGATTQVPEVGVHPRLMELLDGRFADAQGSREVRLVAHPHAPAIEVALASPAAGADSGTRTPLVIAFGPEGGWIERELDTFVARGFAPVSIGAPILRVENAIAAALAQILLLQRLATESR